jgi:ADP-heptose:LPS heptosyltransferase
MSLPLAFDTRIDSIPCATAYLHGDPSKIARWQRRLGERTKTRVGLAWSGRSTHHNDRNRSIALAELIGHLPADLQYVCLQKDIREPDRHTLQAHPAILNFAGDLADFSDSAALCACMDVVVTVDTSVAHLSGALGLETWILLPFNPEWRWLLQRNDSPWYPTVRLRRQKKMRDWSGILTEVGQDFSHLPRRRFPSA